MKPKVCKSCAKDMLCDLTSVRLNECSDFRTIDEVSGSNKLSISEAYESLFQGKETLTKEEAIQFADIYNKTVNGILL